MPIEAMNGRLEAFEGDREGEKNFFLKLRVTH